MVMFTFSALDWKYHFWANVVQKIKSVSISWNLVPKPICVFRNQSRCLLFRFLNRNTLFGEIWSPGLIFFGLKWNLVPKLIEVAEFNSVVQFFSYSLGIPFLGNFDSKLKFKTTIIFILLWEFLMFYQKFFWAQVKRCTIISDKHGKYELPHELSNCLRLRISGI